MRTCRVFILLNSKAYANGNAINGVGLNVEDCRLKITEVRSREFGVAEMQDNRYWMQEASYRDLRITKLSSALRFGIYDFKA